MAPLMMACFIEAHPWELFRIVAGVISLIW
jgi:hypothetical protein